MELPTDRSSSSPHLPTPVFFTQGAWPTRYKSRTTFIASGVQTEPKPPTASSNSLYSHEVEDHMDLDECSNTVIVELLCPGLGEQARQIRTTRVRALTQRLVPKIR